jgi:hypothetical protein
MKQKMLTRGGSIQSNRKQARRGAGDEPEAPRAAGEPDTVVAKDPSQELGKFKRLGGSMSDDWNQRLANDVLGTLWIFENDKSKEQKFSAAVAALIGISPTSELEGMLAAQLLATHYATMECYRRSMIPSQTFEGRSEALKQAGKLSRTFAALLEAFNRHRGKGQQKVTVEHVHVHSGGQAVVGMVETPGGGSHPKSEKQPHAIAYAPGIEMPSPNPERSTVPSTSDAERPLPDARRNVAGRSEG